MKIGISSTGKDLTATVDQRFGRCPYFLMVDTDTMHTTAVANRQAQAGGGAGIQAAQELANAGVHAVISGNVGPNAFRTLQAAGIEVITGVSGTAAEAVEQYQKGRLSSSQKPSVDSHHGARTEER
ncbi:MAG: NifB/NifX family molybdenum-iron cluster-binding protein [Candidatus Thermoplasmatota archaeon]|nr:NifB/NifX family molybdenum-iron cluster-binding protein [Candidatus Thermoplasmatota archaeon]